jgi:hypothetical protein
MRYFVLTQKKDSGCPVGMLDGALYDRFYESAMIDFVDHGALNWYSGSGYKNGVQIFEPFPEGMVLITKDHGYEFDIRAMGSNFHIISEKFVAVAEKAKVIFESCKRIEVRDRQGNEVSTNEYYAARFLYRDRSEVLDETQSALFGEEGILKIKHMRMNQNLSDPAFRLKDLYPSYDGIFCSEIFYQCADSLGGLRGAGFEDIEAASWPGFRII